MALIKTVATWMTLAALASSASVVLIPRHIKSAMCRDRQCPVHDIASLADGKQMPKEGEQLPALLGMISTAGVLNLLEQKSLINHLEHFRETELLDDGGRYDLSQLILTIYSRTLRGPALDYLLQRRALTPDKIADDRARAIALAIIANDQLDRVLLLYHRPPEFLPILLAARQRVNEAVFLDPSSTYCRGLSAAIHMEYFRFGQQNLVPSPPQAELEPARQDLEAGLLNLASTLRLPTKVRIDTTRSRFAATADTLLSEIAGMRSEGNSLRADDGKNQLLLLASNYLDYVNWRAITRPQSRCPDCARGWKGCGLYATATKLLPAKDATVRRSHIGCMINLAEHLVVYVNTYPDTDEARPELRAILARIPKFLDELPPSVASDYARYIFAESPFLTRSGLLSDHGLQEMYEPYLTWPGKPTGAPRLKSKVEKT